MNNFTFLFPPNLFGFLRLHFPNIELKLSSFKDVSINTSTLSRAGGYLGVNSAGSKLVIQSRFNLGSLLSLIILLLGLLGTNFVQSCLVFLRQFDTLLTSKRDGIVSLIPLTERCGVNLNNATLYQSLGTYILIVRGVVNHINDTSSAGNCFTSPGEVAMILFQSTIFLVASHSANSMDSL